MKKTLFDLLDEYKEKFGDQFPMMMMLSTPEEEIMDAIQKCLDSGKKFKYKEGRFY